MSAMDGIGAAVGSGERHPAAMRRGEVSEGVHGGAVGWDRVRCCASPGEQPAVAPAAGEGSQNATQWIASEHRRTACRHDQRCRQTGAILVQHGSVAHHCASGWTD